jgi:hypothetical protein
LRLERVTGAADGTWRILFTCFHKTRGIFADSPVRVSVRRQDVLSTASAEEERRVH